MLPTDASHPSDQELLSVLHGEALALTELRHHLASCEACRARSTMMGQEDLAVSRLLGLLDHQLKDVPDILPLVRRRSSRLRRVIMVAGPAATLALAAAAMVIPASPVHRWVTGSAPAHSVTIAAPDVPQSPTDVDVPLASGIAVHATRDFIVEFKQVQSDGVIEITRVSGRDVAFRSRGGETAYEVGSGRVLVDNRTPAVSYHIDLPETVHDLRLLMGGREILRLPQDSAKVTTGLNPVRLQIAFPARGTP